MQLSEDLTILEILAIAAKTEEDAADFYEKFASRISNPLVLRKIERLAVEEKQHGISLTEEYKRLSGGEEPILPKGFSTGIKKEIADDLSPEGLLELAMSLEKRSEDFYLQAAKRAEDPKGQQVLEYLAAFEADHYRVLETELRQVRRTPDWFDQAHDLIHFGP